MKLQERSKVIYIIISVLLGALFLFSAYSKTLPIDDFSDNIYSRFFVPYALATFTARFFVGLEATLGVLFLVHIYGRWRWVIWVSILLLVVFTFYLGALWYMEGGDVDCGCMGKLVPMNPFWSIVKNLVLLTLLLILLFKDKIRGNSTKFSIAWLVALVMLCIPFFAYPNNIDFTPLYTKEQPSIPNIDLKQGKHIVCFLSLTCSHCRDAATILAKWKKEDQSLPLYFIFGDRGGNSAELLRDFHAATGSQHIPYVVTNEDNLNIFSGGRVPAIFLTNGEKVHDKISIQDYDLKKLQDWYKK